MLLFLTNEWIVVHFTNHYERDLTKNRPKGYSQKFLIKPNKPFITVSNEFSELAALEKSGSQGNKVMRKQDTL